jgi:hypothetical protein
VEVKRYFKGDILKGLTMDNNIYLELAESRRSSLDFPVKPVRSSSTDGTIISCDGTVLSERSCNSSGNVVNERPFLFIKGHYKPTDDDGDNIHKASPRDKPAAADNSVHAPFHRLQERLLLMIARTNQSPKRRLGRQTGKGDVEALRKVPCSVTSFGVPHFLSRFKPVQGITEARKRLLSKRRRNLSQEAVDLHILGNVSAAENDWNKALECYQEALDFFLQHYEGSDHIAVAKTHQKIGTAYYALGRLHLSHDSFVEALRIEEVILDEPGDERFTLVLKNLFVVRMEMKLQMEGESFRGRSIGENANPTIM